MLVMIALARIMMICGKDCKLWDKRSKRCPKGAVAKNSNLGQCKYFTAKHA